VRRAGTIAAIATTLLVSAVAHAKPGKVTLRSGEVLSGEVTRMVRGQVVMIAVKGEHRIVLWSDIDALEVGGEQIVAPQTAAPAPAHDPAPAPAPAPAHDPAPAPFVAPEPDPEPASAPTPAPTPDAAPPPPNNKTAAFERSFNPGFRLGTANASSRNVAGYSIQVEAGYHFSPSWSVYAFWEHGELASPGSYSSVELHTDVGGVGFKAATNGQGVIGFLWDFGVGVRDTRVRDTYNGYDGLHLRNTDRSGFEVFRMALGLSIHVKRVRIEPVGYVTANGDDTFYGFAISGRYDL
jgi:hypothetical protein